MSDDNVRYPEPEKSTLLYVESCLVDKNGRLEAEKMNDGDFQNLDNLQEEGMLEYERLSTKKQRKLASGGWRPTHQITEFDEALWQRVHMLRKNRWEKAKDEVECI